MLLRRRGAQRVALSGPARRRRRRFVPFEQDGGYRKGLFSDGGFGGGSALRRWLFCGLGFGGWLGAFCGRGPGSTPDPTSRSLAFVGRQVSAAGGSFSGGGLFFFSVSYGPTGAKMARI